MNFEESMSAFLLRPEWQQLLIIFVSIFVFAFLAILAVGLAVYVINSLGTLFAEIRKAWRKAAEIRKQEREEIDRMLDDLDNDNIDWTIPPDGYNEKGEKVFYDKEVRG
jgi:hypothetical protein